MIFDSKMNQFMNKQLSFILLLADYFKSTLNIEQHFFILHQEIIVAIKTTFFRKSSDIFPQGKPVSLFRQHRQIIPN